MTAGRPSLYDPAFCDAVVDHMADGSSLTSFAASIDVSRRVLNDWMEAHPEFMQACARAKAKSAAWWEKQGRSIALQGGGPGSATMTMFGMKNMGSEDWKESAQIDHRSGDGSMTPGPTRIVIEPATKEMDA